MSREVLSVVMLTKDWWFIHRNSLEGQHRWLNTPWISSFPPQLLLLIKTPNHFRIKIKSLLLNHIFSGHYIWRLQCQGCNSWLQIVIIQYLLYKFYVVYTIAILIIYLCQNQAISFVSLAFFLFKKPIYMLKTRNEPKQKFPQLWPPL